MKGHSLFIMSGYHRGWSETLKAWETFVLIRGGNFTEVSITFANMSLVSKLGDGAES